MAVLLLAVMPGCGTSSGERGPSSLLVSSGCSASEESEPSESAAAAANDAPAPRPANSEMSSSAPTKPPEEDEGPPDGLTLDAAIERLLATNTDLAAKFQDLPKARADILSAGLGNNPLVFMSASQIPYQRFSEQRPGATQYNLTLVQPIDLSGKRRSNVAVAQQANQVLEARYQDAVRDEIDKLYASYVDVLKARALVAVDRADLANLSELVETARGLVQQGFRPEGELTSASLRKGRAEVALQRAEQGLLRARRRLTVLLALPPEKADCLRLRGSLRDQTPPLVCADELVQLALQARPDLTAQRLNVQFAQAQVRQARAEGFENVLLFFSPYQAVDLSPQNKQSATGWEIGVLLPFPVFNRNQGNVARARINVRQIQTEVEGAEQRVSNEVRRAATEYAVTREEAERYEHEILPDAIRVRDEKHRLYAKGQVGVEVALSAQRDYIAVRRQYIQTLVRHRRSMLQLNTAVSQRLLP